MSPKTWIHCLYLEIKENCNIKSFTKFQKLENKLVVNLIGNIIKLSEDESVSTVTKVREFEKGKKFILCNTKQVVKKSELTLFGNINKMENATIQIK